MADNHKTRCVTSADLDIISNFPEHLIDQILECLSIEDAVRTSVLSRKWRYKWTTIKLLYFDDQFLEKLSKREAFHHNGVIRTISNIMINHNGPILKFLLRIPNIVLESFQEIDQWMLICSRKNVRELMLFCTNRIYPLPSSVFSCLELRKMIMYNCIFKPPREFQGFPNLKHIRFYNIDFRGNLGGTVINLPQLKSLKLDSCVNVNNFHIKTVKLQNLWVSDCPDVIMLRLLHSECLYLVRLCFLKPIEDIQRVERFNLATLLCNLPKLSSFTTDGYFLKFLATENFPKWLPHAVICLRQLELQSFSFSDLDQVQGALCMLRNSTSLTVLRVTHMQMERDVDVELTTSYLESPDCLDQTLLMLQTVEITSFVGSKPELLFIKLLLDHSPDLESMIIRPKATADAEKKVNIAKDVMMFPRASTKAKVVYLDPQP